MKYDVLSAGFPVVEVMRKELDKPFTQVADFVGPFPSGDTCIYIDVAARLGNKSTHIGVVGDDAFGKVILNRLEEDGCDISQFRQDSKRETGVAFVSYFDDGSREFFFLIEHSACGTMTEADVDSEVVRQTRWIHFSGEPILETEQSYRAMKKILEHISPESIVSIDPNFRADVANAEQLLKPFIERANYIFPSEDEARLMMKTQTDEEACKKLAEMGKIAVLKRGRSGCIIYSGEEQIKVPAFQVKEVDPTGCGDSFAAGFTTGILKGWDLYRTGLFANAVGALQATEKGPMEGAKFYDEVMDFIHSNTDVF